MAESPERRDSFRPHPLLWWGLGGLAGGSGPLVVTLLAAQWGLLPDPNPNPVGFGILAFLTFWPSVGLVLIGGILTLIRWLEAKASVPMPPQRPIQLDQDPRSGP